MKKLFFIMGCIASLLFTSCEEDFNAKTDFSEKYILYGVIRNYPWSVPSPYVTLTVAVLKTYDVNGYNPSSDTSDHSIKDCFVSLTIGKEELPLSELNGSQVGDGFTPEYSYTISNFKFNRNQEIKITAVLPDGKILTAHTKVPEVVSSLEFSYPFNRGIHTKINRFLWGDSWVITWDSFDSYLYFPRLSLHYQVKTGSDVQYKSKEIPMQYTKRNGKFEPVYPSYTWGNQVEFSYDCIDSVMTQISEGDSDKSKYIIRGISFGMMEYEMNLASYFSSTNGYLDNFSIRLDESIFTNVSGGSGVFGAVTFFGYQFMVEKNYTESFGYTWTE